MNKVHHFPPSLWSGTQVMDLDLGLKNVLVYLTRNLEIDRSVIYLYSPRTNMLSAELIYVDKDIFTGDEEIYISPQSNDERVKAVITKKNRMKGCYIYIPLQLEDEIYGLMAIDRSLSRKSFNSQEIDFINQIANLIKIGIYQNLILTSKENQIRQQNLLMEVSSILNKKDIRTILEYISQILIRYGKFDRVRIYIQKKPGLYMCAVSHSIFHWGEYTENKLYRLNFFKEKNISDIYSIVRLEDEERPLGFIEVDNIISQIRLEESQINFLKIISNQMTIALKNKFLIEELKRISNTDPLTGVYNYRYLIEYLEKEKSRAKRFNLKFSILLLDIDDFKAINDRFGHLKGDEVLLTFLQTIKATIRDIDVLSRYGGDEFILVAPNTDKKSALLLGNKLLKVSPVVNLKEKKLKIKFSLGIATFPDDTADLTELIKMADKRLYLAKQQGKNQVCGA
ncbi:MAG: sensor domain-containing diguanylate cyclase [bacterium]|nr:sensor domain-containing diguanylate cyclase [bacterium]